MASRKHFTKEFKLETVRMLEHSGMSSIRRESLSVLHIGLRCRNLGIPRDLCMFVPR